MGTVREVIHFLREDALSQYALSARTRVPQLAFDVSSFPALCNGTDGLPSIAILSASVGPAVEACFIICSTPTSWGIFPCGFSDYVAVSL